MTFPKTIKDPEMGVVEWIFDDMDKEEVARINKEVQEKIDFIDSESNKELSDAIEIKEPAKEFIEELEREKKLRKIAEQKVEETQKNLDEIIEKVLQEDEVFDEGTSETEDASKQEEAGTAGE